MFSLRGQIAYRGALLSLLCLAGCASLGGGASSPPTKTLWVYHEGSFEWAGDYSWEATIDYDDKKGQSPDGKRNIAVTITGRWGGFQPWVQGKNLDLTGYKYLTYTVKPTVPDQLFGTGFESLNDEPDGTMVNNNGAPYGPPPEVGKWTTYKIPLSDFKFTNMHIQKFSITDGTGLPKNRFYLTDVGFTVE